MIEKTRERERERVAKVYSDTEKEGVEKDRRVRGRYWSSPNFGRSSQNREKKGRSADERFERTLTTAANMLWRRNSKFDTRCRFDDCQECLDNDDCVCVLRK